MAEKLNVLFIAIDDLRPQIRCYGEARMHTPSLDQLADDGVQFNRAYCQVPVCGASRASMFTGVRPSPSKFLTFFSRADEDCPDVVCMPRFLKANGYVTLSRSKVFHSRKDSPACWSEAVWMPRGAGFAHYERPESLAARDAANVGLPPEKHKRGPAYEAADVSDQAYGDGLSADQLVADIQRLKEQDKPFFLGAGFVRPHLPFNAPQKYWDLYDREAISLPDHTTKPSDVPPAALHDSRELRNRYTGIPDQAPIDDDTARSLIHGYYASVSYLDAQIARVLAALDQADLRERTIVVLFVDHGWNLGEHGLWCKHCLYETSLRIPLIVRAPGLSGPPCDALVENLDIYPTICELTGLSPPDHLEGASLVALLQEPSGSLKDIALSRYRNGESVRTDRFRYSEWRDDGQVSACMLFDHDADPGETVNLAADPEYASEIQRLRALLPPMEAG